MWHSARLLRKRRPAPRHRRSLRARRAILSRRGGKNGIGPNLYGIVGKAAASTPGFAYSPALKASKLKWDEATLNDFLAGPMKKVPGTKMPIGTPDAAKRTAIIVYLKAEGAK